MLAEVPHVACCYRSRVEEVCFVPWNSGGSFSSALHWSSTVLQCKKQSFRKGDLQQSLNSVPQPRQRASHQRLAPAGPQAGTPSPGVVFGGLPCWVSCCAKSPGRVSGLCAGSGPCSGGLEKPLHALTLWGWREAQWLPTAPDAHCNAPSWDPPLAPPNLSLTTAYSPVAVWGYSGQQQLCQRQTLASWCHLYTDFAGVLCPPPPV